LTDGNVYYDVVHGRKRVNVRVQEGVEA